MHANQTIRTEGAPRGVLYFLIKFSLSPMIFFTYFFNGNNNVLNHDVTSV